MKITIENTSRLVTINGVPARVWEGTTENGVAIVCLVTRIAVAREADVGEFERDLVEQRPPSVDGVRAFPLRMVL